MAQRAGQLRQRITLQSKTIAKNTYGEDDITWTDEATVWASIEPLRGQEYLEARQEQADINARVRLRYYPNVKTYWRVKYVDRESNTRYFDILSVIEPLTRGESLNLMVREAV